MASTPKPKPPTLQKSSSQTGQKNQKSLLGFFQKKSDPAVSQPAAQAKTSKPAAPALTPAPSSDAGDMSSPPASTVATIRKKDNGAGLPSPPTSAIAADRCVREDLRDTNVSSPSRKVRIWRVWHATMACNLC